MSAAAADHRLGRAGRAPRWPRSATPTRCSCTSTASRPAWSPGRTCSATCVGAAHAYGRVMSGFNTRAIHAGQEPDPATGAVIVPVHLTTTYKQDGVGGLRGGYEYSRSANPTRTALQEALAALEQGTRGHGVRLRPGRRGHPAAHGLPARRPRRARRRRLRRHVPADLPGARARGASSTRRSTSTTSTPLRAAMRPTTRVIWCETPTNPLLNIADIAAAGRVRARAPARCSSSTTPSPRPTCSSR